MQVIRFNWNNRWKPELVLSNKTLPLLGRVNFSLGPKFCIGYWDNTHHDCPNNERLVVGRQCRSCRDRDVFAKCLGCDGSGCDNLAYRKTCKQRDYIVYLAAFGDLLKVGISSKHRFKKRFVEQGADFAAKISELKDGREARILEKAVSEHLDITDRVWGQQKMDLLLSDPNDSVKAIESAYNSLHEKFELSDIEIYDLRSYYGPALMEKPKWVDIQNGSEVRGEISAVKGSLLFLKTQSLEVLDAHRMIGRLISLS
jgi:hypothetical protein